MKGQKNSLGAAPSPYRFRTYRSGHTPFVRPADTSPKPTARLYKPGQNVFRQGGAATHLYEVVSGLFLLSKVTAEGRRHVVEIAPAGWICGFADGDVHDCSCEALTEGSAITYLIAEIESRYPLSERERLWGQTAKQICSLHHHAMDLVEKSAEERVAAFLMRFIPERQAPNCSGPAAGEDATEIEIPLSGAEIGDYLGLRSESISRAIRKLQERGLIRRKPAKRRGYLIRDVCGLCQAAHNECNL